MDLHSESKGPAIWAMKFGEDYPSASVIGTDLAPCQPIWVSPNVEFQIDDATGDWTFPAHGFDYIHMREPSHGVRDFPRRVQQCHHTLKPGGWIEFACTPPEPVANDDTLDPASCYMELVSSWNEIGKRLGVNTNSAKMFNGWFQAQGFTEVREWKFKIPCSPWAKDPKMKTVGAYEL